MRGVSKERCEISEMVEMFDKDEGYEFFERLNEVKKVRRAREVRGVTGGWSTIVPGGILDERCTPKDDSHNDHDSKYYQPKYRSSLSIPHAVECVVATRRYTEWLSYTKFLLPSNIAPKCPLAPLRQYTFFYKRHVCKRLSLDFRHKLRTN